MIHPARRYLSALATLGLLALTLPLSAAPVFAESAATVPAGFRDELVWAGLTAPTAVDFAANGKTFVTQKDGKVYVFDSLTDASSTLLIDLTDDTYNYWDRGLLGLAVDPAYPSRPYIYVLYTYDHILGDPAAAPKWGGVNPSDSCPTPPGGNTDGCIVSGRLERLTISGNSVTTRKTLITDWCQQFPSHTVGGLLFGPEGALYVTGGDGASFDAGDWGQFGGTLPGTPTPVNPCNDPIDQGGAVRSQDFLTGGDPLGLDGTIVRVDPDTGDAWPDNANAGSADDNVARVIGYGLRNPFRFAIRPNGHIWIGDVGWTAFEEIDRITNPDAAPRNFGWPCLEGNEERPQYENVPLCTTLSGTTAPMYTYDHMETVVNGDPCGTGSSSLSGMAFSPASNNYPASYDDGLFFTDYTRQCIWFAPDNGGTLDFGAVSEFANLRRTSETDGGAVFLGITNAGDLIYTDYDRGEVRAIRYYPANAAPSASFTATPSNGPLPLAVNFDASNSTDSNGDTLTYAWDLDGDGQFDDSTARKPSRTYTQAAEVNVGLRVTDDGVPVMNDTTFMIISAGQSAPTITWPKPSSSLTWKQGTVIAFSASAADEDGAVAASGFAWTLVMEHCPADCHDHVIETIDDVKSGSFVAPFHGYPSNIRIELRVTDSDGLTTTKTRKLKQTLPFTDIKSSKFLASIFWLAAQGITSGCTATKYCPEGDVTRGQMASFLSRAMDLPSTSKDFFNDDERSPHEKNINKLAAAGITSGCGTKKFCPDAVVSRGQMASFLAKALDLPSASKDWFTDDNNNAHERNINRLRKANITSGCTPTKYCPTSDVSRGQMAAFLFRAFGP